MNEAGASQATGVSPGVQPGGNLGSRLESALGHFAFHPLLFAAYPVLLLYSDNLADVDAGAIIAPTLVVLAMTLAIYLALALVVHDPPRAAIVTSAFIIPAMLFGVVAEGADPENVPGQVVALRGVALALATTVLFVSVGIYLASRTRLVRPVTQALNVFSIVLLGLAAAPILAFALDSNPADQNVSGTGAWTEVELSRDTSRDIYHLVFDPYGSETALAMEHGIDNTEFLAALEERGFQVVEDARANHLKTSMSLASTMSMSLLDDLAQGMGAGSSSLTPIYDRIEGSRVGSMLQDIGYRYVHVGSWYAWTRDSEIADSVRHLNKYKSFSSSLIARSILSLGTVRMRSESEMAADTLDYQLTELDAIASESSPKYVFAHILLPHPPFIYLADGTYAPGEATFESQLRHLNTLILDYVDPLLALPEDERPIIILQADEGPYPAGFAGGEDGFDWATATDEELLVKFGVLNAMYLPGPGGLEPLPEAMTVVNTYPELFRRYFGASIADLPNESFTSTTGRPYDLANVTERLDRAEARLVSQDD